MNLEELSLRVKAHEPVAPPGEHLQRGRAAVLVPLIAAADEPRILLTERATSLGKHSGEVAFPGGKQDDTDHSLEFTALRETEEEIGLATPEVDVIGELRPFVSKYGLLVSPYVGIVRDGHDYVPNPDEIAAIFEVPLSYIMEDPRIRTDVISRHGETHHVPAFRYEGFEIWGLTAMILVEFMKIACERDL